MDDLPIDYKPKKARNNKTIILIIVVLAILSFAVYTSYNTKYVDPSTNYLHATVIKDLSMVSGRLAGTIINDGEKPWDVNSVNVIGGKTSCFILPKGIKSNQTISLDGMYCSTTGIELGDSYSVLIYVNDVDDKSKKYLITGTVQN